MIVYRMYSVAFKNVSMRKPGRRWYSSNHRFRSNSAQMLGLVSIWSWQKIRSKYFIPFKLGGPPPKNCRFSLNYAYLISCLWFNVSTTRKVLWKWKPQDFWVALSTNAGISHDESGMAMDILFKPRVEATQRNRWHKTEHFAIQE